MKKPHELIVFGANVRGARTRRSISQEKLAELAGLHRTYVGGIERGERNVSLINICKLAEALEATPESLLEGVSREPQAR